MLRTPQDHDSDVWIPDLAGLMPRAVAFFIDSVLLMAVEALLLCGSNAPTGGILLIALGAAYFWFFWTDQGGQTLGQRATRIRVVKTDGGPLNTADSLIRYTGYLLNLVPFLFGIGWLWAFLDDQRQGWHDKMARTFVVTAESALPEDKAKQG